MGQHNYFDIDIENVEDITAKKMIDHICSLAGYENGSSSELSAYFGDCNWSDYEVHLKLVSQAYPYAIINITQTNDCEDVPTKIYAQNGRVYEMECQIIYPSFEQAKAATLKEENGGFKV